MRRHPQVLRVPPNEAATRFARPRSRTNWAAPVLERLLRCALAAALASGLASCQTADDKGTRGGGMAVGARLVPIGGSAVRGLITFRQVEGGVAVVADFLGGYSGRLRIVIHANGNCSSPNGFSAGPPLVFPGTAEPAAVTITAVDGYAVVSTRMPGLTLEGPGGIGGKAVVVHAGEAGSLEAQPGVPNNRVACGVIDALQPLF
jgi:Cu-Zn family superoxide dismutase